MFSLSQTGRNRATGHVLFAERNQDQIRISVTERSVLDMQMPLH